jgi:hypothetical protein
MDTQNQKMPSKDDVTHLTVQVADLTFHHGEQEDLLWMKTIALKSGKNIDITIDLRGKLRKTKFGLYPTMVNLGYCLPTTCVPRKDSQLVTQIRFTLLLGIRLLRYSGASGLI